MRCLICNEEVLNKRGIYCPKHRHSKKQVLKDLVIDVKPLVEPEKEFNSNSNKEKLYNTPLQKETNATFYTPIKLKDFAMLVCGFCGQLCSEFNDRCGKCGQRLIFKYDYARTNESGRYDCITVMSSFK